MTTLENQDLSRWKGATLLDEQGEKIGTVADIYLDDQSGQPEWIAVSTGWFGSKVSFIPLEGTTSQGGELTSRWSKDQVRDAPHVEADGRLSPQEEERLYRHYGVGEMTETTADAAPTDTAGTAGTADAPPVGRDVSGPTTDNAMTRSEEELRVGTTQRESGRVRLRKWVETEQVNTTVPVSREEVRIEREPITEANVDRAASGPALSEEEHEIVLHEEQPVVDTEVVPRERVRLDKETLTDERQVSADLAKEHIEVEGDEVAERRS